MLKKIYHLLQPKTQTDFLDYKVNFSPRYGHGKPAHNELYAIIDNERENYEAYFGIAFDNINAYLAGSPQNCVN